ncbi:hypothetical protein RchiOBHm_Chr0c22g0500601 [Rosa chinensis]|uniref:Uncharacterized protein n=1 Tax=Rosa chinensis TaxID=74649 RepID=A0A2P6SQH8_ROSCH|nr:hypothetical protein RchiOBHm_Chr7g0206651 [Rosa chinensis]PRQ60939.1 hypothetical protein RchiOBHm_Chr0c22g0500601 [Rosa chinensis]
MALRSRCWQFRPRRRQEAAGMSLPDNLSVVGVLHQPSSQGNRLLIAYENGLIVLGML